MTLTLLLLSLALIGFWIGGTARYCLVFNLDEEMWIFRMFLPVLAFMVWLGLFIFALGRGWL